MWNEPPVCVAVHHFIVGVICLSQKILVFCFEDGVNVGFCRFQIQTLVLKIFSVTGLCYCTVWCVWWNSFKTCDVLFSGSISLLPFFPSQSTCAKSLPALNWDSVVSKTKWNNVFGINTAENFRDSNNSQIFPNWLPHLCKLCSVFKFRFFH